MALHAEVRAMLLGRAVPGDADCVAAGGLARLSDVAYRDQRAGADGMGRSAASALLLLGDPQLPNGVSDESVRVEARMTLLATAARLLVDGVPATVRRHEVVNMAGEAVVLLGGSDPNAQALGVLDAWTQSRGTSPFGLLEAAQALGPDGGWLRQALPPVAQRLREAVETLAAEPGEAAAYAGDVEGWLQLTGYAGDAPAKARALRCRAVDALTAAGEVLGAAQVLAAVDPPDLARLGRLREAQGRLEDAAETFEQAGMPAEALRNWRNAGNWEQAVRLAAGAERSDLEWLVDLDTVVRRRPAEHRKRLTAGERQRLVQTLDSVERLPRSGRAAAAATAMPLVVLPALGPGLRPGFVEAEGMPPVPASARTGRFFGRHVMEFQNWTLASNARWRLSDEQLAALWQAEFPNARTRYTIKSVRTVRNLFNQARRNNDRPAAPVPEYGPSGNPVVFSPPYF